MNTVNFSLGSFLRLCQLDTDQKLRSIERKLRDGSGYDYYHTLNKAIREHLRGSSSEYIQDILMSPSNASEREYNLAAYKTFSKRYGSKRTVEALSKPKTYPLEGTGLKIKCDPVFSTVEKDVTWAHAIWAARTPPLQQKYGAVGCLIMRECYRATRLANATFAVANLVDGKRIGEAQVNNTTAKVLRSDAGTIWQMIQEVI